MTPLENGATAVTTIGGCGCWYGLAITPWPSSGISVRAVEIVQNRPARSYGAAPRQIARMWSIASTNIAVRSWSRLPKTSASEGRPPGLMPKMKRPFAMWSTRATSAATIAGW
jgi:hypothetical protein